MKPDAPDVQPIDPLAAVEAGCAQGAALVDPVRFRVIEAMARRAGAQQGEARALMVRRVEAMLDELAAVTTPPRAAEATEPDARQATLAGLSALVNRLGRSSASRVLSSSPDPLPNAVRKADAPPPSPLSRTATMQPLKAVTAFKSTWSRLRADTRLREALAQVPAAAGPLNTSQLVNRTLQAMRDVSPEYLDAFMAHVDTLQWLEQASGTGDLTPRAATPAEAKRRAGTREGRKG